MKEILLELYKSFKKIPCFFARQVLIVIFIIVFFDTILGAILFYAYAVLPEKTEPEISKDSLGFREDLYNKVLIQWQNQEQKIEEFSQKSYSNPFGK